jgi:hypothetical protein
MRYAELPPAFVDARWPPLRRFLHRVTAYASARLGIPPPPIHFFAAISTDAEVEGVESFKGNDTYGFTRLAEDDGIWVRLADRYPVAAIAQTAAHEVFHRSRGDSGWTKDDGRDEEEVAARAFAAQVADELRLWTVQWRRGS